MSDTINNFEFKIHQANIDVHRYEAHYYELLHPEVYSLNEQKRILSILKKIKKLLKNNCVNALDVGAGTGNLTGKLLSMGCNVTAVDISPEMCNILKKKYIFYIKSQKLKIFNSPIERLEFKQEEFDLIACYSVLHHLPNYIDVLDKLNFFLKDEGVMYLDHEASPFYWANEGNSVYNIAKLLYFHSSPIFNKIYFNLVGLKIPSIDYTLSDYWHKKNHFLEHNKIKIFFLKENYAYYKRTDYHLSATWLSNPFFYLYKRVCKPEMSYWIAKK